MYLGKRIGKFKAVDNADLVVPRVARAAVQTPEPVVVEKTVYVEVEKIVEVPVPQDSVFFGDTVPAEWSESVESVESKS